MLLDKTTTRIQLPPCRVQNIEVSGSWTGTDTMTAMEESSNGLRTSTFRFTIRLAGGENPKDFLILALVDGKCEVHAYLGYFAAETASNIPEEQQQECFRYKTYRQSACQLNLPHNMQNSTAPLDVWRERIGNSRIVLYFSPHAYCRHNLERHRAYRNSD
jgi:hypothetical protein